MIPVIKWTLWQRRWSTLWWAITLFALIFFTLIFYPSFKDEAEQLQKTFADLPDAAVQLFGGSSDFFSPIGYLNSQLFFFVLPLVLGILAIGMGSNLIGKEEQDLTIESLLSRPISRTRLLIAKAVAGIIILTGVSLIGLATTIMVGWLVELAVPARLTAAAYGVCFLLVLSFGAIAFLLSSLGRARAASIGITTFIAFGGYIISSLAGTVDWLRVPSKIFPFDYYKSEAILRENYDSLNLLFFVAVILGCALIAWLSFRRRDLI
ncbi:MAG TPA: ABC transporter permease subunit [Candidatus Saccharimonadales bacterium]|nr:ABC transporter permease subunit [Candidatus Saccharimonadales bacterium]